MKKLNMLGVSGRAVGRISKMEDTALLAAEKEHEIITALMNEIALLKAQLAEMQCLVDILTENAHTLFDPEESMD